MYIDYEEQNSQKLTPVGFHALFSSNLSSYFGLYMGILFLSFFSVC
jgi:hypothetical protein